MEITGPIPNWAAGRVGAVLLEGHVLFVGGDGVGIYDQLTGTWIAGPPMREPRDDATVTVLRNGSILVAGGTVQEKSRVIGSAELYHPDTGAR